MQKEESNPIVNLKYAGETFYLVYSREDSKFVGGFRDLWRSLKDKDAIPNIPEQVQSGKYVYQKSTPLEFFQ